MSAAPNDDAVSPMLPRFACALNDLAERCGLEVSVSTGPYSNAGYKGIDSAPRIWSDWVGTKKQLFSTGLFTPCQQRRLPMPSGSGCLQAPASGRSWEYLLLAATIDVEDDDEHITLTIDSGPAKIDIEQRGPIEVVHFSHQGQDYVSYQGTVDELIASGISPKRLPRGTRPNKAYRGSKEPAWISRLQPDGSCLHRVETMDSWKRGIWGPPAETARAPAERVRSSHLRLVIDNTRAQS